MPSFMQTVGIACLTLLIPIAIAIFTDGNDRIFNWEKGVIVKKVINPKQFLWALGLLFIPSFFWAGNSLFNLLLLVPWGIGCFLFYRILIRTYKWLRYKPDGYRQEQWAKYINNIQEPEEMISVWTEVFAKEEMGIFHEEYLIKLFITNFGQRMEKLDIDLWYKFLKIFSFYIDKQNLCVLNNRFGDIFRFILQWRKRISERPYGDAYKVKRSIEIEFLFDQIISKYITYGLSNPGCSYQLFNILKEQKDTNLLKQFIPVFF